MSLRLLRRRLERLEKLKDSSDDWWGGPVTAKEAAGLVERVARRDGLSAAEVKRLERWGPVVAGEWVVRAWQGQVAAKQYVDVNLAEV